jgi:hypothetical protein
MKEKKINALELKHSEQLERFNMFIDDMVSDIQNKTKKYEKARRKSKDSIESSLELSLVEALNAKIIRHEILAKRSSLILLRSNAFYHNIMVTMIQDARMGIEYDKDKLESMVPPELTDLLLESIKGMETNNLLDTLVEEITRDE